MITLRLFKFNGMRLTERPIMLNLLAVRQAESKCELDAQYRNGSEATAFKERPPLKTRPEAGAAHCTVALLECGRFAPGSVLTYFRLWAGSSLWNHTRIEWPDATARIC